jgi:hypothetical protein
VVLKKILIKLKSLCGQLKKTKDNLVHKGWMEETFYVICGAYEDIDSP